MTSRCVRAVKLFVTNNMKSDTLRRVYLTFTYVDGSGRMLHSQSREVECELPPAETRQMNVPSWDVQQNFLFCAFVGIEPCGAGHAFRCQDHGRFDFGVDRFKAIARSFRSAARHVSMSLCRRTNSRP